MNVPLIAIVDDESMVRASLGNALEDAGFSTVSFARAAEFEANLNRLKPSLCIIDLGLPDRNGLALLNRVTQQLGIAVIIISGRASTQDKINGLELGADDYLVKPFDSDELTARIKAVLRRVNQNPKSITSHVRINEWHVDLDGLSMSNGDNTISLSLAEIEVLRVFMRSPGRLLTREQIQNSLGQNDASSYDRAIDVRISRLRAKFISNRNSQPIIKTIYGGGYIFVADFR